MARGGPWLLAAAVAWSLVPIPGGAQERDASTMPGAPLRSLAVPGWGQLHMGQSRGWAYLALEAAGWIIFAERTLAGADLRNDYRDLAWTAARIPSGGRQDGDFAYYEFMSKWERSGAFDMEPGAAGIQPETDPSSFNGSIWALASDIYIPPGATPSEGDPAYQQALAYYVSRAYAPAYLWDWSRAPGSQSMFIELIHRSDDRFRQATTAIGAVIANHLISAADAYLSGGTPGPDRPLAVWAEPHPHGTRVSAFLRIGVP